MGQSRKANRHAVKAMTAIGTGVPLLLGGAWAIWGWPGAAIAAGVLLIRWGWHQVMVFIEVTDGGPQK